MLQDDRLKDLLAKLAEVCIINEEDESLTFVEGKATEVALIHQDIRFLLQDKLKEARGTEHEVKAGYILLVGSEIQALIGETEMTKELAPLAALVQVEENIRRKVWQ